MSIHVSTRVFQLILLSGFIYLVYSCDKDPLITDQGSFTDERDGNIYTWVEIGSQTWMTQNLAFLNVVTPSAIGSDSLPFSYVYDYESNYVATAKGTVNYGTYGVLYNWLSANNACPDGWHLPSDAEWTVLGNFLGGDSLAGTKMRSKSGWKSNGNGDNSSSFNGKPAGYRNQDGGFFLIGENAGFWTATGTDSTVAWVRDLGFDYPEFGRSLYNKNGGFSVRCLKN